MTRLLVIMGSGETTPTMIKPHRRIFESLGEAASAVLLDTPYGFQLNADEISARTVGYFAQSVGRKVDVVSWRTPPSPGLERERALTALRSAGWIFAGPGSPTYALRQWRDTELPSVLAQAEVLVFASAAALTLGSHTIPVYEIYKAGIAPSWEPGLGLFAELTGVPAVVIPHYDNAEGGHHDTRYCYLGEPRLSYLESQLPPGSLIVGVDEHTALLCDLEAGTASVIGNGGLTLRRNGSSVRYESGAVLPLSLEAPSRSADPVAPPPVSAPAEPPPATSLRTAADEIEARFTAALDARDLDGCISAALELEQCITDWTADTNASDDADHARSLLRGMILRLGDLAVAGVRDPAETVGPFVEALLDLRSRARDARDFATSDRVRDALTGAGVEVRDTPTGPEWLLHAERSGQP
jgi:cyanophycinase-like exopeptidase